MTKLIQRFRTMAREILAGSWKPTGNILTEDPDLIYTPDPDKPVDFDMHNWVEVNACGTSACIIGHAMLDERFPEFQEDDYRPESYRFCPTDIHVRYTPLGFTADYICWKMLVELGQTEDDANDRASELEELLFMPESYNSGDRVSVLNEFLYRLTILEKKGFDELYTHVDNHIDVP